MDVGEEWIYRVRDYAASERIKILTITPTKQKPRVEVEFLDGEKSGIVEVVPSIRLRGEWNCVAEYDAMQANWSSIQGFVMSETEDTALYTVFRELLPESVAELIWSPVQRATTVHDQEAMERIAGMSLTALKERVVWFVEGTHCVLAPEGSMILAEAACRSNPAAILDWVVAEELEQQKLVTEGEDVTSLLDGEEYHYSPQQKYRHYLERYRPVHELLRQWCGHQGVSAQERVDAAETEVGRLNDLVSNAIAEFKRRGDQGYADQLRREFHEDRITPWNVRPIVDRPLSIDEMPIRYVDRKRNWPLS